MESKELDPRTIPEAFKIGTNCPRADKSHNKFHVFDHSLLHPMSIYERFGVEFMNPSMKYKKDGYRILQIATCLFF